jgi:hypothetical protein
MYTKIAAKGVIALLPFEPIIRAELEKSDQDKRGTSLASIVLQEISMTLHCIWRPKRRWAFSEETNRLIGTCHNLEEKGE